MFSRPKILFLVSLLSQNSIPTYLSNFLIFYHFKYLNISRLIVHSAWFLGDKTSTCTQCSSDRIYRDRLESILHIHQHRNRLYLSTLMSYLTY